jgi:hypothetical protein
MKKNGLAFSVLFVFLIMFALSLLLDLFGLSAFFAANNISSAIINVIIAFFSSFIGLFIIWRNIIKMPYSNSRRKEVLLALFTALVFTLISLTYGVIDSSGELLRYGDFVATSIAWNFLSSLGGFLIGFLIGGIRLQRMAPPAPPPPSSPPTFSPASPEQKPPVRARTGKMLVLFLLVGAVVGFLMGCVTWFIFGQIQLAAGIVYAYAAILPPPTYYLLAWTGFGAIGFAFEMPSLLKARN